MGFDNQLFSYFRDGDHEGMAITILGPRRSIQTHNKMTTPYKHDTSIQTEVRSKRDRDATTRDWERERARRRYCRDLDVRYFSSLKNLKDRILSGYTCNQFQCPMIRERLESHQHQVHGKRPCEKGCSHAGSKAKNCVSIKAGPDFDQFVGSKCADCPLPESKSSCKSTKVMTTKRNYHESCGNSNSKLDAPVTRNLRLDPKATVATSTPIKSCCMPKNEYTETKVKNECKKTGTSYTKYPDSANIDSNSAKEFYGRYESTGPSNVVNGCDNSMNLGNFCGATDVSRNNESGCCGTPVAPNNDVGSSSNIRNSRYVNCYTEPNDDVVIDNSRNTRSCCVDTNVQYDLCMSDNSYTGAIEAPKFALVSTGGETMKDRCKLDTEIQANCNEIPFIIKFDKGTDNSCVMSVDTSQEPDNETSCSKCQDQATANLAKCNAQDENTVNLPNTNVKNKVVIESKNPHTKSPVDSSTSYKLVTPYGVEGSSNDVSEISVKTKPRRRSSNTNPIYREVKEWIREVPLYPGLGKEAKESNKQVINDLISNLYELSSEAGSKDYDDKVRNKIDECLNNIPLWYPGAKREQKGYKRSLVDRLHSRIKSLHRKNSSTSQGKGGHRSLSEVHTSMISCHRSFNNINPKDVEIRICVIDWLRGIYSKTSIYQEVEKQIAQIADYVILRLKSLLNKQMSNACHKVLLKTAVMHLLNDLPTIASSSKNTTIMSKLAEDLAEGLLKIEEKYCMHYKKINFASSIACCKKYYPQYSLRIPKKTSFIQKCFEDVCFECNNLTTTQSHTYHDEYNIEGHLKARQEIMDLLLTFTNLSDNGASKLTEILLRKLGKRTNDTKLNECASSQTDKLSQDIKSANTSFGDLANPVAYLLTSTPKKKQKKKDIPKISQQEIKYMDDLSKLIRAWMSTLPQTFDASDEKGFKETVVKDLASDISEAIKVEQLTGPKEERREVLQYVVCRWILRLGAFEIQDVIEQINSFIEKVEQIPVPVLTQPQHGTRQALASTKAREGIGAKWGDNYVQKGTDVLEDEISIWMNEQPSSLFADADKAVRQDKIHELAQVLHNNLGKKRSEAEVNQDIQQWLNRVLKPEKRNNVSELTPHLRNRIINLPQDQTLITENEERVKYREEQLRLKAQKANAPKIHLDEVREDRSPEHENTMSMFISDFIEHHYDVDDPLARRAFNRLLNSHLLRLSTHIKKEVYENFENKRLDNRFPPRSMLKELQYIKDISDWLKNLPVDGHYNTLGNNDRTDFVNSLAISIREIEDDREKEPCAMDYDSYMLTTILEHLKLLPLPEDYYANAPFMVDQLYRKIISHRQHVEENIKANESTNTTGVNPDNIGDFIEEFIKINGAEIANDEIKMEAWAIRLIREIKKLVQNVSAPGLSKAQVYDKLVDVPVAGNDTAKYFNIELDYVEEITKWIKNLPLLPMNETEKSDFIVKICYLAEKVAELDRKLIANPKQKDAIENELKGYVEKWISDLPLDKKHKIVFPVATQQLINRLAKVKRNSTTHSNNSSSNKSIDGPSTKPKKSKSPALKDKKHKVTSSSELVDKIEKWSKSLPVTFESDEATTTIKNDISRRLCQSVGQLNMDPKIYNDDSIYKDHLKDDVNVILEDLPLTELAKNRDKLKEDLVDTIIEMKNNIKEKTAGESYKHTLEKTIDTSLPNPILCTQVYDPGFEIYKDRLATMFILENFDHSNDAVKIKHEQLLRKEIDKYFDHAKNRNALPLSKDKLYSELYGNLYKVPVPNEASVIHEVEKLKTRCEVDSWFEELPLREPQGLNELLDCDKILAALAAKIHAIETSESKADDKISKEILKWLTKLPLRSGYEEKYEEFATNLEKRLKSTSDERKCVLGNAKKGKKDKSKSKNKDLRPSSSGYQSASSPPERRNPRKNATNEIYETLQNWCNQLPISVEEHENPQAVKDELTTYILIKISEINRTPEIFDNDSIYYEVIGQEVEKILSSISSKCSQCPGKAARINQLKEALRILKPLVEEERATAQFKQDLNEIVENVLNKPQHIECQEKIAYLDTVKNEIIDDFIQYKYANDDDEEKQRQKADMKEKISTYITCAVPKYSKKDSKKKDVDQKESKTNILMKTNQLITELTKVAPQNHEIVRDEVEEIRMKNQVTDFFDQLHIPGKKDDKIKVSYAKESLARRLNELELSGHTPHIENKMKKEIEKCLTKLGKDKNQAAIDNFIAQLKRNENERRILQTCTEPDPLDTAQRKFLPTQSPDSLENYCKRVCDEDPRLQYNNSQQMEYEQRNFSQTDDYLNQNTSQSCPAKNISDMAFGYKQYKTSDSKGKRIKTCPASTEEGTSQDDESSTESDEDTLCICKSSSKRRRRAYCMVPLQYFCEGFDRYDSYWCRMPVPGYF